MEDIHDYAIRTKVGRFLGISCQVNVKKSYRAFRNGKFAGFINFGIADIPKEGLKEVIVIGENYPLVKYHAQIIAIAHDRDGQKDDILVAAKENSIFYEPDIAELCDRFIPKGSADFICYFEKSCGAVLFHGKGDKRQYLLITNLSGHIGFPKGHIEYGESEKQTAGREVYEETGIHAELIDGFRESYHYRINTYARKKAVYYLSAFVPDDIRMRIMEISEYRLVSYEDAKKILEFRHDKQVLEKAELFIRKHLDV